MYNQTPKSITKIHGNPIVLINYSYISFAMRANVITINGKIRFDKYLWLCN